MWPLVRCGYVNRQTDHECAQYYASCKVLRIIYMYLSTNVYIQLPFLFHIIYPSLLDSFVCKHDHTRKIFTPYDIMSQSGHTTPSAYN